MDWTPFIAAGLALIIVLSAVIVAEAIRLKRNRCLIVPEQRGLLSRIASLLL